MTRSVRTPSEAALARAVKRRVWPERWPLRLRCAPGLEAVVADEVRAATARADDLDVGDVSAPDALRVTPGTVALEAPFDLMHALLAEVRVADVLSVRIAEHAAATTAMAFDHLARLPWAWWLPARGPVRIAVRSRRSRLRDAGDLERTVRRAVRAAGVAAEAPRDDRGAGGAGDVPVVRLELERDRASVWVDVAHAMHRRGTGKRSTATTLRETTAAALAHLGGAADADLIIDPFCGSGTLLQEARDLAAGRPVGAARPVAMRGAPVWNEGRLRHALRRFDAPRDAPSLVGRDADPATAAVAAEALGAGADVRAGDARTLDVAALAEAHGARRPLLLTNPPYGRRSAASGDDPDALLRRVLAAVAAAGAAGPTWRWAVVYPRPAAWAEAPGLEVASVRRVRIRGLSVAFATGRTSG
ncbi:MAG: hypothetical protein RI554_02835 [Trueperaceae bacterium]|nr:hypothetical protein [Trueperaceae bacterium]